jgi:hypothetical protein
MTRIGLPLLLLLLGAACSGGARDVDYPRDRGISADIGAAHQRGSTAINPGMTEAGEPLGAIPWQLDERHQPMR